MGSYRTHVCPRRKGLVLGLRETSVGLLWALGVWRPVPRPTPGCSRTVVMASPAHAHTFSLPRANGSLGPASAAHTHPVQPHQPEALTACPPVTPTRAPGA